MRSSVLSLSVVALTACSLSAQPLFHNARSWTPQSYEFVRQVPCDLDYDDRDDVLLLRPNHTVVRAANPGLNTSFTDVPELTGTIDLVAIRRVATTDLVVTVSSTAGLAIHGMRPEGNFLTLASNPSMWSDVTELRVFDWNGPVLAGRIGSTNTIRTARVDLTSYSFNPIATATFSHDVLDFALSKRVEDPDVHVFAATTAGLERLHVNGAPISWLAGAAAAAHVVQLPGSTFCAWARQTAPGQLWTLQMERNGAAGPPLVLDYDDTDLEGLELDGLAAADFNDDGLADLVLGQTDDGTFGVLYGSTSGYQLIHTAVISTKSPVGTPQQTGAKHPPTVVGHPDGDRDGIFHVAGTKRALDVLNGAPPPIETFDPLDGLEDWMPHIGHALSHTERLVEYEPSTRSMHLRIFLPPDFLAWTNAQGHTHMQIETWRVDDLVDVSSGNLTLAQSSVYPTMQRNLVWDLRTEGTSVAATHDVVIPLEFGTTSTPLVWQGRHALMLVRVGTLQSTATDVETVTGSLFTTPIWIAMNEFEQPQFVDPSPFLDGLINDPFFDPGIGNVPADLRPQGGAKDIARVRGGLPVLPPLPAAPVNQPVESRGTTG